MDIRRKLLTALSYRLKELDNDYADLEATGRLRVGFATYGRPQIKVFNNAEVSISIGSYTSIAHTVQIIIGGRHSTDSISTYPFDQRSIGGELPKASTKTSSSRIEIGSDVWISSNVTILDDVSIGNGAIVAAHSVVTRSVPDYAVVAGVPARIIKYRFDSFVIEQLKAIRWWEWPTNEIISIREMLTESQLIPFLDYAKNRNAR